MTRVLVVDDDPAMCEMASALLERAGYEVRIACSAREALQSLESWCPQAMIMDIVMPDMDGIELLREIRKQAMPVAVVAVTGGSMGLIDPLARLMSAMGVEMLTKPFLPQELTAALGRCLNRCSDPLP